MKDGTLFEQVKSLLQGRYVRLTFITLLGAVLIYIVAFALFMALGIKDGVTHGMMMVLSLFGSGWLVYKYIAERIG